MVVGAVDVDVVRRVNGRIAERTSPRMVRIRVRVPGPRWLFGLRMRTVTGTVLDLSVLGAGIYLPGSTPVRWWQHLERLREHLHGLAAGERAVSDWRWSAAR